MVDENDGAPLESRPPTLNDLAALCKSLNECGARYIVVGGMAIIQLGFVRATEDIDLLVDASTENVARIKQAMSILPDNAAADVEDSDVAEYTVVRVADEFVVDLMQKACGVDFDQARPLIEHHEISGVNVPFASAELMWRLKQTVREKDKLDQLFLRRILDSE